MFGEGENPKFVGILANTMCIGFNALTLLVWFQILTGYLIKVENVYVIAGCLTLLLLNCLIFFYNNKADAIIAEFASESRIERKRRTIWCWIYVIATFAFFLGSVLVLSPKTST